MWNLNIKTLTMEFATLVWCTLMLVGYSYGQVYDDERLLLEHLFSPTRYNKHVRPALNRSMPVTVNFSYRLIGLADMNVATQDVCAFAILRMSWTDEMLTWNASDYGGIQEIVPPYDNFWKPSIDFSRKPSACKGRKTDPMMERTTLQNDGTVYTVFYKYMGTVCTVNVMFFPFDHHKCVFRFYDTTYDASQVLLDAHTSPDSYDVDSEHTEWIVKDIVISVRTMPQTDIRSSVFRLKFYAYRRPGFIIIHNLIPASFICLLNTFVPLIPPDSGERLSYAITTYLATVFMTVSFYDNIPNDSVCTTLMSYNLVMYYAASSLTLIWSIGMICMSRWSTKDSQFPACLRRCLNKCKRNTKKSNSETPIVDNTVCACSVETPDLKLYKRNIHKSNSQRPIVGNTNCACSVETRDQDDDISDIPTTGWYEISRKLDKVYFVLQVIGYVSVIGWNSYVIGSESWGACDTI